MSNLTYQQRGNQDTRIPVGQRRTAGGKALEDNRGAFAAKQLKQGETAQRVEEEDELVQGKSGAAQLVKDDKEETAQAKFSDQGPPVQREEQPAKPNNTGLPDKLKNGIESLSGMSMDNVRVHYNSSQPAQLNALAYAQGTDIHVGPGQEKHLPHEAWHVVQQKQGRVRATVQMKGIIINDDSSLEKESDIRGEQAVSNQCFITKEVSIQPQKASQYQSMPIIQCMLIKKLADEEKNYYKLLAFQGEHDAIIDDLVERLPMVTNHRRGKCNIKVINKLSEANPPGLSPLELEYKKGAFTFKTDTMEPTVFLLKSYVNDCIRKDHIGDLVSTIEHELTHAAQQELNEQNGSDAVETEAYETELRSIANISLESMNLYELPTKEQINTSSGRLSSHAARIGQEANYTELINKAKEYLDSLPDLNLDFVQFRRTALQVEQGIQNNLRQLEKFILLVSFEGHEFHKKMREHDQYSLKWKEQAKLAKQRMTEIKEEIKKRNILTSPETSNGMLSALLASLTAVRGEHSKMDEHQNQLYDLIEPSLMTTLKKIGLIDTYLDKFSGSEIREALNTLLMEIMNLDDEITDIFKKMEKIAPVEEDVSDHTQYPYSKEVGEIAVQQVKESKKFSKLLLVLNKLKLGAPDRNHFTELVKEELNITLF